VGGVVGRGTHLGERSDRRERGERSGMRKKICGRERREDKAIGWAPLAISHVHWTRGVLMRRRTHRALSPGETQAFSPIKGLSRRKASLQKKTECTQKNLTSPSVHHLLSIFPNNLTLCFPLVLARCQQETFVTTKTWCPLVPA
jgi:hypothetical protein